jgi:hypothetical protein
LIIPRIIAQIFGIISPQVVAPTAAIWGVSRRVSVGYWLSQFAAAIIMILDGVTEGRSALQQRVGSLPATRIMQKFWTFTHPSARWLNVDPIAALL